ncbi:preprotein translocase subunit SecE [Bogoriella caseilytica]|uniref:Protein translocase subunit SecE n=1 Tax=Bogoriella caseilytica TaxID=56055 RepID=A0A3N2BE33_9MICO|nr:preprotein translocase subunit SecE [Bogoriella caseilytica]ROR73510.1 preprotein translocase subunit SecE [Bogoriella caseilytica]
MSESASATPGRPGDATGAADAKKPGFFGRIILFVRQVIGELKKVVQPTRNELWTFFLVVLVFVAVIMTYVGLLDLAFTRLAFWVFG